ncbi:unnamed protein product [Effrenium voratum]|uniref:VASt domain-containing protein n=1 Tax=Effrenium voratum TaxID=2562239 RepID=A0AA36J3M5_9DINO|nr:unnamed protein product [Effrenium voratum]CAJ1397933.1 unnamed protein product [Effrenium voratum]
MLPVLCTHVKGLSLPRLEDSLLANDWGPGCMVWDYWVRHEARELTVDPWHWDTPPEPATRMVTGKRKVAMIMPVPAQPMCPPETRVTVNYTVSLAHDEQGRDHLSVKSSAVSHDVPYGDHFSVDEKIEMVREADGVLVTKMWTADFVKRTFLRGLIESRVKLSQADTCEKLMAILQAYADESSPLDSLASPMSSPKDSEGNAALLESDGEDFYSMGDESCEEGDGEKEAVSTSRALMNYLGDAILNIKADRPSLQDWQRFDAEVWELQRRTTMFHDDWRSPFLPHDSQKRARWVDERYRKHCWVLLPSHLAATAELPPLQSPPAMGSQVAWHVATDGEADKDGWQYAADFYKKKSKWGVKAAIYLCRRRRWKATFVRIPKVVTPRVITVQLWELQRRTTIFQSDWRAPFLPHDAIRHRFRWVDMDFNVHPWCPPANTLASADKPPIRAPVGWEAEGWVVAQPPGSCDSGRWQYSSDLNRSDKRWGSQSTGLGCRRRLWSCIFTEGCRLEL